MNLNVIFNILLIFCFINTACSQKANWVIEPVIEGVDEINTRWAQNGQIVIKKNKLEGMINLNNELLAPPIYKYVSVDFNGKVINGVRNDESNDFYSLSGRTVSREQYREMRRMHWDSKGGTKPTNELEEFLKNKPKVKLVLDEKSILKGFYSLYTPADEQIVAKLYLKKHYMIGDKFMVTQEIESKEQVVVNIATGEIIHKGEKVESIRNGNGYFYLVQEKTTELYSQEGKLLREFEEFTFCKDENFGIGVNKGKEGLYKLASMEQIGESIEKIHDHGSYFVYKLDDKTFLYKINGNSFSEIPHVYKEYQELENNNHLLLIDEDRVGLWDITKDSWIIQPEFASLVGTKFNHYIAKREKQLKRYSHMTLFDSTGKMVYDDSNLGIYCFHNLFKVTELDTSITLRSYTGETLESFSNDHSLTSNSQGNILTAINEKANTGELYHVNSFFKKEPKKFDKVERVVKTEKPSGNFWYIVRDNNLLGIIDYEGTEVLPIVFEKIDVDKYEKGYIKVVKNKKWGVLLHP